MSGTLAKRSGTRVPALRSCVRRGPTAREPTSPTARLKRASSRAKTASLPKSKTLDMKFSGVAFSSSLRTR